VAVSCFWHALLLCSRRRLFWLAMTMATAAKGGCDGPTLKLECMHNSLDTKSSCLSLASKVARWFVFKPKVPIRVNFEGP
jgi:hypothetical protein